MNSEISVAQAGDMFIINNEPYLLCSPSTQAMVLICLIDGKRWSDQIEVTNHTFMTKKEFEKLLVDPELVKENVLATRTTAVCIVDGQKKDVIPAKYGKLQLAIDFPKTQRIEDIKVRAFDKFTVIDKSEYFLVHVGDKLFALVSCTDGVLWRAAEVCNSYNTSDQSISFEDFCNLLIGYTIRTKEKCLDILRTNKRYKNVLM